MDAEIAGGDFADKYKYYISDSPLGAALRLHSSEAVALGFVAVGLAVVERLQLLSGRPLFSGLLFPQQLPAVVVQVTRQQETSQ